ncbi:MAG TPA: hypothetical protein VK921_10230 [Anditalea sp.]|nr:hypothetical protein [Anditalea sp.]
MNKINFNYLETYSKSLSEKFCSDYFGTKKYMTGQEIIQLTPSQQVNLLIIKSLFSAWQDELEKLKSNPYFDYRDIAVDNSLKEFMNILSRAIKVERLHFEPLMRDAVEDAILLAIDPVTFFIHIIEESKGDQNYFKANSKYIKWHSVLMTTLIDKASMGASSSELKMALRAKYENEKNSLEHYEKLLGPLHHIQKIDYAQLVDQKDNTTAQEESVPTPISTSELTSTPPKEEQSKENIEPIHKPNEGSTNSHHKPASPVNAIDPALAWARFESEEYSIMKGSVGDLSESVGINQRFMFTRELFQGNADLMKHALKSIDQCDSFVEAVELINHRYVGELDWDKNSDEVNEFLQLVFRKFEHK